MSMERESREGGVVSRRDLLVGAGALASVAVGSSAFAAGKHDHATHAPKRPKLLESLEACTTTGRLCISHCLVTFQEGDTSLAACAAKVHEMMAVCSAMETLVASNSSYAEGMARVCIEACKDCAAECKKHADEHRECRDCMEACRAVVPLLKELAA